MASKIPENDNSQAPCPSCQHGTGYLRSVKSDRALKILTYRCQTCAQQWQASERWTDDWWVAQSSGPNAIRRD